MTAIEPRTISFNPASLGRLLDGRYAQGRDQIREVLKRPEFAPPPALPTPEYRQLVMRWAKTRPTRR